MRIQRWDIEWDDDGNQDVFPSETGYYVTYQDHKNAALAMKEERNDRVMESAEYLRRAQSAENEIIRLRVELAAKSKDVDTVMNAVRDHGNSMTNSEIIEHLTAMGEGNGR